MRESILQTIAALQEKQNILFLTTSNRWSGEKGGEKPKSSILAEYIAHKLGDKAKVIDVAKLKIYPCEGNVSTRSGNTCGVKKAILNVAEKNPSGCHRCWASINNPDDELWVISKELLKSDAVVFFGSVRWGQMNAIYQKLIERLTWLENRHSTLGEENILANISAGMVVIGHNWNGAEVLATQKQVLGYFGFKVEDDLCWNWQFTTPENESDTAYIAAGNTFEAELNSLA